MSERIAETDGRVGTWSERGIHTGVAVRVMLINLTAISTGFWKERSGEGGRKEGQSRVREW